ncbi:MAG TPA: hypothetical protein DDZ96_02665 [Porphyromonadaceae bacterium]|jgi:hypothetical protein|nr:hypothetical protein [Porphyromonadaceae bacterium]HBX19646.1 hypothetical protein [Porphyromonadaceae bacterium]HCM22500.1 hypothetical protein [Porphyromonadaceae bacterium]
MENFSRSLFMPTDKMKVISIRHKPRIKRSSAITIIVFLQFIGWMIFLGIKIGSHLQGETSESPRIYSILSQIFLAAGKEMSQISFIWLSAASALSIIGLLHMKSWGWVFAIVSNALWIFSMAESFEKSIYLNNLFQKLFFISFLVYIFCSSIYLWTQRIRFWK